ncbi:NACHT and WD repeat domain-containing protein [Actinosynnema sp. CA-299493]
MTGATPSPVSSPSTGPLPVEGEGRRLLVATAVTSHRHQPEWDRPELAQARREVIELFTGRFGYRHLSELGLDPTRQQLIAGLEEVCSPLAADPIGELDMLAVYITCHGHVLDDTGEHVLVTSDTHPEHLGAAVTTADLTAGMLRGTKVRRLLLMLDTCQAGRGGNELAAAALSRLTDTWGRQPGAGMAVIVSAQPSEEAATGVFPRLLRQAVDAVPVAGHGPQALDLQALVTEMNKHAPGHQRIGIEQVRMTGHAPTFLPNPRHDPALDGVDLAVQQAAEWRAQADERELAFQEAVVRKAMGSHDAPGGGWWFTGRHTALHDLTTWLNTPDPARPLRVVTGDPGSGKSAVLGLLATLADPDRRHTVPAHTLGLPSGAVPTIGVVDTRLTAQQATTEQILHALASAARLDATSLGRLLAGLEPMLRQRGKPFTVLLDGVDEAATPHDLVGRLLAPLVDHAQGRIRLLVGTRPHMLPALAPGLHRGDVDRVIDLDDERYADTDAMTAYTLRTLLGAVAGSTYRDRPRHRLLPVAEAVVNAAHPSFLVARITATTLASQPPVTDPEDPGWRRSLPRLPGPAMRRDLDTRLGVEAARARDLLLPLAFVQGNGLPWEDLWAPLASRISRRDYTDKDLLWLRDHAGSYIVENTHEGRSLYRLYHQALVEHLRDGADHRAVHDAFVDVLLDRVPLGADARTAWFRTHPYTRAHLATHAAEAGRVDEIITDPEYLVYADPDTLLPALQHTTTDAAVRTRAIYRNTVHRDLTPAQRRLTLAIDATRFDDTTLATELAHNLPWRPRWATGKQTSTTHRATLTGHTWPVRTVACTEIDGQPVAVTASSHDRAVRIWNLTDGTLRTTITGHTGRTRAVMAVACTEIDGQPVAVTASGDGTVRVWDLADGTIRTTLTGPMEVVVPVGALACTEIDGQPLAVTGSGDGTVRVWNLSNGTLHTTITGHTGPIEAVACTEIDGQPVAVTASSHDRAVRIWNLTDGTLRTTITGHTGRTRAVMAVACTEIDGQPVAVTANSHDRAVRVWNLTDGTLRTTITGHTRPVRTVACTEIDGQPLAVTGSGDGTVRVWNLSNGTLHTAITGHTRPVMAVACAKVDGQPLAVTGDGDGAVRVWDLEATESQATSVTDGTDTLAVTWVEVDGQPAAVTGSGDGTVRVWNLSNGTLRTTITGHTGPVEAMACTKVDGQPVAVTASRYDRAVRVWNLTDGTLRTTITGHTRPIRTMACTEIDGQPLAVTASGDGTVHLWNLSNGTLHTTITGHTGPVEAMACTKVDGQPVAVTASNHDRAVRVWNLTDGTLRTTITGHTRPIRTMACTEIDGQPLAVTASSDGTVHLWNLSNGTLHTTITGHTRPIRTMACTEIDGQPLAVTASSDGTVHLWNLSNGQGELLFRQNGIQALTVTPNIEIVNSTGWDLVVTHRIQRLSY